MTAAKILVETIELPIRWGDMDALGHVNNSRYFTCFEQVRVEWLKKFNYSVLGTDPSGPTLVNAACTFHHALVYPSDIPIAIHF